MRWILAHGTFLGVAVLSWSGQASACSCGGDFTLMSTTGRVGSYSGYELVEVEDVLIDAGSPIILRQANWFQSHPEVYLGDTRLEIEVVGASGDSSCSSDFLALFVLTELEEGDELTVRSPDLVAVAQGATDPSVFETELDVRIGPPRQHVDTTLDIDVDWEILPPFDFSESLCPSPALSPYEGQGLARVTVTSQHEVEFYASVTMTLPGGENFSESNMSRYVVESGPDGYRVAPGSWLSVQAPLSNSSEAAECLRLSILDHRFETVFDQDVCPEDAGAELPHASLSLPVTLATIPTLPEDALRRPEDEATGDEKGCVFAPGRRDPRWHWYLWGILASTSLLRRRLN